MTDTQTNGTIRGQIFYWIGILASVVIATIAASSWINQPVEAVELRVRDLETDRVTKDDFVRLETKVDSLLIRLGVNPTTIK